MSPHLFRSPVIKLTWLCGPNSPKYLDPADTLTDSTAEIEFAVLLEGDCAGYELPVSSQNWYVDKMEAWEGK